MSSDTDYDVIIIGSGDVGDTRAGHLAPSGKRILILERGDSFRCPSDACENVPMSCDAMMLVRIVDATDDNVAYVSECFPVAAQGTVCALADVSLPAERIPNGVVRIQVAVWRAFLTPLRSS